jgi:hypothetical protein
MTRFPFLVTRSIRRGGTRHGARSGIEALALRGAIVTESVQRSKPIPEWKGPELCAPGARRWFSLATTLIVVGPLVLSMFLPAVNLARV